MTLSRDHLHCIFAPVLILVETYVSNEQFYRLYKYVSDDDEILIATFFRVYTVLLFMFTMFLFRTEEIVYTEEELLERGTTLL